MQFKRPIIVITALAAIAALVLSPAGPSVAGSKTESRQTIRAKQSAVDWDAARIHPRLEMTKLSERQKQMVQRSDVPVLLPDREGLLPSALITIGPGWYAASMSKGKVSAVVSGNSKVIRIPGAPQPRNWDDPALKSSGGEGMREVSFQAFGVYYDLSVECFDHQNDTRCTNDNYVMQLVDRLKVALIDKP